MPETVQALAIAVVAVLPGALGVWGYERQVGKWSIGSPDRVIRFVATSAAFHAALASLTYWLWRHYVHSGRFGRHDMLLVFLWLAFFATNPNGWMRIRLKSGRWIGGGFAPGSYASGYPEAPDLYLVATAEMDPESGDFLVNEAGGLVRREGTLFVNGTEIEYFEFMKA